MTSFATDEVVRAHVAEKGLGEPLWFCQTAAPRLRPDGSVFVADDGAASLYGPGHGDVLATIRSSGALAELQRRGVRTIVVSNVDNLGARLDPVVVGMHAARGDAADGRGRCEGQRHGRGAGAGRRPPAAARGDALPAGLRPGAIPVFNTNTSLIEVDALAEPVELTWLVVEKTVDERDRGAVRAALPRALGARPDDVPRRASPRAAGALPAGQGAGGSRRRCSRCCARCSPRRSPSGEASSRIAHTSDTESSP